MSSRDECFPVSFPFLFHCDFYSFSFLFILSRTVLHADVLGLTSVNRSVRQDWVWKERSSHSLSLVYFHKYTLPVECGASVGTRRRSFLFLPPPHLLRHFFLLFSSLFLLQFCFLLFCCWVTREKSKLLHSLTMNLLSSSLSNRHQITRT